MKLEFNWEAIHPKSVGKAFIPLKYRHSLDSYVNRAGLKEVPYSFFGIVFYSSMALTMGIYINPWLKITDYLVQLPATSIFIVTFFMWFGLLIVLSFGFMIFFKLYLDVQIFKRKLEIEEVLPDFLQLASANIRAGMSIDRALWYAVRPRFGILANEIEIVAKETISGRDLNKSLMKFAEKYDSNVVKRSISLLIKGADAGGEIGDLLNNISMNIQENRTMKREMGANVLTYVIFISFATIVAAPFLFALSYQLLTIIQKIMTSITLPSSTGSMGLMINLSSEGIKISDFNIFAIISLASTSFFSAVIVAIIRKGNIKEGIKYIPIFIITSITLFIISRKILHMLLGSFI